MKKLLAVLLIFAMLLSVTVSAYGDTYSIKGSPFVPKVDPSVAAFDYTLRDDGTVSITGFYVGYLGPYATAVIPSEWEEGTVTDIASYALASQNSLDTVIIPDTVRTIGNNAFQNCRYLRSVTISNRVTVLNAYTFFDCINLKEVKIPASVTTIDATAFHACDALQTIYAHPGSYAEQWAKSNGYTVKLLDDITPIGVAPDYDYEYLADGTISIAMYTGNEESIIIPAEINGLKVTKLGKESFYDKENLRSVTIPDGVTTISSRAFCSCSALIEINIPDSVTTIESEAFYCCTALPALVLPKGLTSIAHRTFEWCTSLKSIVIPDNVTTIDLDAFDYCPQMTSVSLPANLTSLGTGVFRGCASLQNIVIPEGVTTIEWATFYECSALTSIELPASVTQINNEAFAYCSSLETVYVQKGSYAERWAKGKGYTVLYGPAPYAVDCPHTGERLNESRQFITEYESAGDDEVHSVYDVTLSTFTCADCGQEATLSDRKWASFEYHEASTTRYCDKCGDIDLHRFADSLEGIQNVSDSLLAIHNVFIDKEVFANNKLYEGGHVYEYANNGLVRGYSALFGDTLSAADVKVVRQLALAENLLEQFSPEITAAEITSDVYDNVKRIMESTLGSSVLGKFVKTGDLYLEGYPILTRTEYLDGRVTYRMSTQSDINSYYKNNLAKISGNGSEKQKKKEAANTTMTIARSLVEALFKGLRYSNVDKEGLQVVIDGMKRSNDPDLLAVAGILEEVISSENLMWSYVLQTAGLDLSQEALNMVRSSFMDQVGSFNPVIAAYVGAIKCGTWVNDTLFSTNATNTAAFEAVWAIDLTEAYEATYKAALKAFMEDPVGQYTDFCKAAATMTQLIVMETQRVGKWVETQNSSLMSLFLDGYSELVQNKTTIAENRRFVNGLMFINLHNMYLFELKDLGVSEFDWPTATEYTESFREAYDAMEETAEEAFSDESGLVPLMYQQCEIDSYLPSGDFQLAVPAGYDPQLTRVSNGQYTYVYPAEGSSSFTLTVQLATSAEKDPTFPEPLSFAAAFDGSPYFQWPDCQYFGDIWLTTPQASDQSSVEGQERSIIYGAVGNADNAALVVCYGDPGQVQTCLTYFSTALSSVMIVPPTGTAETTEAPTAAPTTEPTVEPTVEPTAEPTSTPAHTLSTVQDLFSNTEKIRFRDVELTIPQGSVESYVGADGGYSNYKYVLADGTELLFTLSGYLIDDRSDQGPISSVPEARDVLSDLIDEKFLEPGVDSYRPSDYGVTDLADKLFSARHSHDYTGYGACHYDTLLMVDMTYCYVAEVSSTPGHEDACTQFMDLIRDGISVPYEVVNATPVPIDLSAALSNSHVNPIEKFGLTFGLPALYERSIFDSDSYSYDAGATSIWLDFEQHPVDSMMDYPCKTAVCTDGNADTYLSERANRLMDYSFLTEIQRQRYQLDDGSHALRFVQVNTKDWQDPEYVDTLLIARPDGVIEVSVSSTDRSLDELVAFHMDRVISTLRLSPMDSSAVIVTAAPTPSPTPKPIAPWEIDHYVDMGGLKLAMPKWTGSNVSSIGAENIYYKFGEYAEMNVYWYPADKLRTEGAGDDLIAHVFRKFNSRTQQRMTYADMQLSNGMRMVRGEDTKDGLVAIMIDTGSGVMCVFAETYNGGFTPCQEIADTIVSDLMNQVAVVSSVSMTADEFINGLPAPTPTPPPVPHSTANGLVLSDTQRGTDFGRYELDNDPGNGPEELSWSIVDRRDGMALLVSAGITMRRYNETREDVTWETSDLRQWLNGEFYQQAFSDVEKSLIVETLNTNPDNPDTDAKGGNDTLDRVFLLSLDEALYYFSSDSKRTSGATASAIAEGATINDKKNAFWLTRTPGNDNSMVAYVDSMGQMEYYGHYVDFTKQYSSVQPVVRAAVWVRIDGPAPEPADPFCQVGSQVYLGSYEQDNDLSNGTEPILWRVLKNEDGQAMLMSENILESMRFSRYNEPTAWEESDLFAWLNGDFYQSAFTDTERSAIIETETFNPDNPSTGTQRGEYRTNSHVFLLSYGEAFSLLRGDTGRLAQPTAYTLAKVDKYYMNAGHMQWFLRTQGWSSSYVLTVSNRGAVGTYGTIVDHDHIGVRPVLMADIETLRTLGVSTHASAPAATAVAQPAPDPTAISQPTPDPVNTEAVSQPQPDVTAVPVTAAPVEITAVPVTAASVEITATPAPTAVPVRMAIEGIEGAFEHRIKTAIANSRVVSNVNDFSGAMTIDGDETTCWQFSTKKMKLGNAALEITLRSTGTVDELWIKNGFWRITNNNDQYTANCRPKQIGVSFLYEGESDYKDEIKLTLKDDKARKDWQILQLGHRENVSAVKLRVISIYKGTKYKTDVAISEIKLVEREGRTVVQYETLKKGSKGDDVIALKERLQELGYFKKNADLSASYNDTCVQRVKQFQKRNGLKQTGIADQETLSLLYSEAALPAK